MFFCLGTYKVFNICNLHGLKLLTKLRLGLIHLRGHKFNHNFIDCLDEICMSEKISNLRTISSSDVAYFLKKD